MVVRILWRIKQKQEATRSNPINKSFEKPGASENLKSTLSEKAKKKD